MIASSAMFEQPRSSRYPHRWECSTTHDPILLGRYDDHGNVQVYGKGRMVEIVKNVVRVRCPKCGEWHRFDAVE